MSNTGVIGINPGTDKIRRDFFETLFQQDQGYLYVAFKVPSEEDFTAEAFIPYPDRIGVLLDHINRNYVGHDAYFCTSLLTEQRRKKPFAERSRILWADLDDCDPRECNPLPSISVVTSPGRFHGYWLLDEALRPDEAEHLCKRIAYAYASKGADKKGWDLTQLLRVPQTYNVKRGGSIVGISQHLSSEQVYSTKDFEHLPPVEGFSIKEDPIPQGAYLRDARALLDQYKGRLDPQVEYYFKSEPNEDWSGALWRLESLLAEAGLPRVEIFAIAKKAKCNKYERDKRDDIDLWRDVTRAYRSAIDERIAGLGEETVVPPILLEPSEEEKIRKDAFVFRYAKWAGTRTDASLAFHEAGAFVILSTILAGRVECKLNVGDIKPNLWFMLMGPSTLSRKSTSMQITMDVLNEIDDNAVLATDGSVEGILKAASLRPGRAGVFKRDEFSGLLAGVAKKEYLAGLLEALCYLYDGTYYKRELTRGVVEVRDPVFIMFVAGVTSRIIQNIDETHILSGFAPRFVYVSPQEATRARVPVGHMTQEQDVERDRFVRELSEIRERYKKESHLHIGKVITTTNPKWPVRLTDEAIARYNKIDTDMEQSALESSAPEFYGPMFARLTVSTLKAAMLLAAARQDPVKKGYVELDLTDMLTALSFTRKWINDAILVVRSAGLSPSERTIEAVFQSVHKRGRAGILRSELMRNFHLDAKATDVVFETLDQRGLIHRVNGGKKAMEKLYDTASFEAE